MFSSVTASAVTSAVEPVITPVERSNSPPIISSATAIAMMPMVAAGSRKFPIPAWEANTGETRVNPMKTRIAAPPAPTSGVISS